MTETQQRAPVYAAACEAYRLAGWTCVIPVPPEAKFPPPGGFTGAGGRDTAEQDIAGWAASRGADSIALRMPDGLIGIDVDEYAKGTAVKHGAAVVTAAEAELGPLPPTYTSTARGDGPSRIRFYQVPPGRYAAQLGPDVEIIQRHHRYAVVAPSPHAGTGTDYRWYAPDGSPLDGRVPGPGDMAELPPAWVAYLAAGASAAGPAASGRDDGMALLDYLLDPGETACVAMAAAASTAVAGCTAAEAGSRHDAMTRHTYEVVQLAAEGHPGCAGVLDALRELWDRLTAGEDRGAEFGDMLLGAARKAVTAHGPAPARADACLFANALRYDAPAPGAGPGSPAGAGDPGSDPVEPARWWSPFGAIGAEPFDPAAELDAPLARDVLARTWPVLRYAADAGSWIVRGPDRWDVRKGDLAKWAVDLVSWLMLPGDPAAPEGSDDWRRARKRARFATNASAGGIAGKMHAQVTAGHHPSAVELAELDGEREVLWAGGVAYDLRLSAGHPEPSRTTDPGTPHLHSAGVIPRAGPTPLWDAFLAAVWPDPELRAWALRVLSIAVTGYSDKALPIMLGETDRGKTSVIDLMMSVLGSYAHTADARLLSPADRSHASIVFALKGRRLSFIDEAPRAGTMAQERLKQITGGADLTANRMNENPVTFPPTHTLILTANPEHEPNMLDAAIRRRVRLIPCTGDPAAVVAARAAIGNLSGPRWRGEAPGVLAALMAEAAGWLADPGSADSTRAPEAGRAAALEIQESQDYTLSWVREECEPWQPGTKAHHLFEAFTESCKRKNIHPSQIPSEKAWALRVNDLGYDLPRRHDGKYKALRVRTVQGFVPSLAEFAGTSGGSVRPEAASGPGSAVAVPGSAGTGPGSAGTVQGQNPPPETLHNGNTPGKTLHNPTLVQGVQGDSLFSTHTHTRTHTHADSSARYTPAHPAPGTGTPVTDPPPASPAEAPPAEAPPPEPSPAVAKTRKAKAAPPRPDPELEGPVHPLPVIVARDPDGGPPRVVSCSPDDARLLAEAYLDALCVDCETTGYPPGHADFALRTVQLGGEQVAAVLDPADPAQAAVITDLLARARGLHAHSAAADLVPLAAAGLGDAGAMWGKMTDSVLIAKLADPQLAGSDENQLKKLADDVLPAGYAVSPPAEKARSALFRSGRWLTETTALTPRGKSGWAMVKPGCETMARYAGSDVLDLAAVLRALPPPDGAVLAREREFQEMCARVSHQGFRLDPGHITAKIAEYEAAQETALQRVTELCPAIANPSSTTEVPAALGALGVPLERTRPSKKFPQGQLSAAKEVLEPLAADPSYEHRELLRAILDYRHDVTTLGLLLRPLGKLCSHGDGRMRPVVYTINADTGRTSCVRPNGQQFSRQGGIRACVIADEGMAGISADFSGVEIRVGAALSGDLDLLAAELSTRCQACGNDPCDLAACGKDQKGLHWMAARMAFGPGATKEARYNSKRIIFSKMFGGGPDSGARQVGLPAQAGRDVHRAFEAIAPRFTAWDQEMRAWVKAGNRSFTAYSGRIIWLPPPHRPHAAGNYAIQGTAREFLVDGCLRWKQTRWGHLPLLPIHDEIFTFVPAAEAAEASQVLRECMRSELRGVPIEAAASEPFTAWPDSS